MDSRYEDEGPGPQLSVELLRSIWTTQQNDDDDASSNRENIPANSAIGKRKRQDSEVLRDPSPPLVENNAKPLSPFKSVKLKRPQRAKRVASETARNNRGRKDTYVIPDTPKPLKRFTRNVGRHSIPKTGTFNDFDSELDKEGDSRAAYRSNRAGPNVTNLRDDEKVSASGEWSDSWSEEEESADEDQHDENYRSEEEVKEYTGNRGLKQTEYAEPPPSLSTPRRSSRLRVLRSHPSYGLFRSHRRSEQAFSSPKSAGSKRPLTRLMKKMLDSVEAGEPPHSSPPPQSRAAESENGDGSDVSSAGEDPMHEDSQQAGNRAVISPPESPENNACEEGGDVDTENEHRIAPHSASEHDVQIRTGSENNESDHEVQSEHESVSDICDFEDGSEMESESGETDVEEVPMQDPDDVDFWSAAALFGQHTNWSDLFAEVKKLIPSPNLTQRSPLLRKPLAAITQAKQLYARTREIRQDYQTVPDYLCEAEKSNAQKVVEQIYHILSRVRLVFDEKGNLVSDNRELKRKRQAVLEIAVYAVPGVLTQLLQSFSLLCERIQPKFFRPYIHFGDTLQQIRVVKWVGPRRSMQYKRPHRQEVTLPPTDDEQDDHVSIISIDENSSNEQLPEGPDEFPWTTAESEALVTGLERYQGLDRYTMIRRDFRTELSGRTMEDLRVKAREIRDSYVAAVRLDNLTMDPRQWGWLLEV
ncbi:hypothetical protein, variant [Blastomyces dermatitidis ATCC 18188]|uniref:Uncharacterized protein n=1 Tax=Ajellomyces dermatitidis (strain ATCC 18188 / CBS 674.68) TaxID=653446 RepID=A0A0J9EJE8_AJEDA|nr:hypothetical protein, variant [Blastomyces dermatitidis ATCC 26199]KMW66503.1 hypothetical protein, variant [Blastomyces dermatitidis ATCC 18188]